MLRTVSMALQGDARAGQEDEPLGLKSLARVDRFVGPPGPMDPAMVGRLGAPGRLQSADQVAHLLRAFARTDEHRVGGGDDREVLDADRRQERLLAVQIAALAIERQNVADQGVPGLVRPDPPQGVPRADVAPSDVGRQHGGPFGLLHDGVID